jgi:hypothetical protein
MSDLPPFVTIAPPPPELQLGKTDDRDRFDYWPRGPRSETLSAVQASKAFPELIAAGEPEALRTEKMFACSGSPDSSRYREATLFRAMQDMGWEEARIALNRLMEPVRSGRGEPSDYVALAEFALTATGFAGFVGKRGEHAVKLREALGAARMILRKRLSEPLHQAERDAWRLSRPITAHGYRPDSDERFANAVVRAFWTLAPTPAGEWPRIVEATADQALAALDYLRATLATWDARRPVLASVLDRLSEEGAPTAAEYAEAIHIADMLVFTSTKLVTLYAGLMHSMPIYRLYPSVSEAEAIALWWPWGRPAPLVSGAPPRPPKPRKRLLDPSVITATRPQDVVREVMQKTGINRTTAQSMTSSMRAQMRQKRLYEATRLLRDGLTKAEVARRVGLSPSRISALFKGEQFRRRRAVGRELTNPGDTRVRA